MNRLSTEEEKLLLLVAQGCDLDTMATETQQSRVRTEYYLDLLGARGFIQRLLFDTWTLTHQGRAYIVKHDLDK